MMHMRKKMSCSQIIILGFASVIAVGSLLLMCPAATSNGQGATGLEALFTATSAVCVTGLVVQDTATYWSVFGQAVILLLIQIGGMGVVTIAVVLFVVSGRKVSLRQRSAMQESIAAHKIGGVVRLADFIICTALFIEAAGTFVMGPVFCKKFGLLKGIWYALFHSVSAMCNAGFDLMGVDGAYSSLTSFASDPVINFTIMTLIVIGGIGFLTWDDIRNYRFRLWKYSMQSRVIFVTTAFLILLPAVYFYLFEFQLLPEKERMFQSFFQSVTPRTAGFNTTDLTQISDCGILLMIGLMLIGGSPGSTAGGMKTTTFAVILFTAISVFHREEDTHFFGRRVDEHTVRQALTIAFMYLVLFLTGGLLINRMEGIPLISCLFESASAVGTVGLTLGITPNLGTASRLILILLMFIGRVGGLTLIFSTVTDTRIRQARLPLDKLTVG